MLRGHKIIVNIESGPEVTIAGVGLRPEVRWTANSVFNSIIFQGCQTDEQAVVVARELRRKDCAPCSQRESCGQIRASKPIFHEPAKPFVALFGFDTHLLDCKVNNGYFPRGAVSLRQEVWKKGKKIRG